MLMITNKLQIKDYVMLFRTQIISNFDGSFADLALLSMGYDLLFRKGGKVRHLLPD
jgi:hypothetical protein